MSDLAPPDLHCFNAAQGWLELGNLGEARLELDRLSSENQSLPDVLELRWELCARGKNWQEAAAVAGCLVAQAPERCSGWIHCSYSLHELKQTQAAFDQLLPALKKFPEVSTIPYNLACYSCQLGRLDEARQWLASAMRLGEQEQLRRMARRDADLQPLWAELDQDGEAGG